MADQPWGINQKQGRLLYEFICKERPREILELGCGIGTSACYISAALAEIGLGQVTSIDRNPDLPDWVDRTFSKVDPTWKVHHKLIISPSSYNDELLHFIENQTINGVCHPLFDFCFIDGAHTWEADGCAFFLCEKLLKPGGWLLFDDLTWTVAGSLEARTHLAKNGGLCTPIHETQQVMSVFKLLVTQHPRFEHFTITDDWGWARKRMEGSAAGPVENLLVELYERPSLLKRLRRRTSRMISSR